ncbi:MAG: PepSY domain-containing protein [Eubacteriales bacterium]
MTKVTLATGILVSSLLLSGCSNNTPSAQTESTPTASPSVSAPSVDNTVASTPADTSVAPVAPGSDVVASTVESDSGTSSTSQSATNVVTPSVDSAATTPVTSTTTATTTMSEAKAKEIALAHAGVSAEDVIFAKVELDYDNGVREYEVEFYAGNMEYDYEIHAETGAILGYDHDMESLRPSVVTPTPSTTIITEAEAKEIALAHAGVSASNVTFAKVALDYDNGVREYEVEFYAGNTEYDYEIHAESGKILSYDHDMETPRSDSSSSTTTTEPISQAKAKEIALAHAGILESQASRLKVEFEYDDGIPEYSVEFYVGNTEYEYEIHGTTGQILGYDRDDD